MEQKTNRHIGTSGWNYKHWKGPFYPDDLSQKDWLDYYLRKFQTVEINNSFYQLPEKKTFETWRETVPAEFVFSVKASRYITHMKKLKDPRESLNNFLKRVAVLEEKVGAILFQLPPRWRLNSERLQNFLSLLPKEFRYTFEFRDATWFDSQTYEILAEHNAAFCIYHLQSELSPKEVTADFVYIRLHGPSKQAYQGQYSDETLAEWKDSISSWTKQGKDVYCYFDNDEKGYAAQDALRLQQMLG
ncbi:DUF72 domain-containing protein [candidate division KSB1 bacterium]|nr:DUF72 domain-containing protein [candidate division KSB1 bacterium]NIR68510.1 DUF72 domain-containing protein [candidate division KSB1 bacterium]NIS22524.1 DUF72 domain-containing protein [candidate division KSB1 bacterium]NIT69368.1 DUF72 domain-containing protein [candidate division KSB1 bacterium]NIU23029.1 DUF72 domain-containing protein [candidate division KSB1 bacterium]